MGVQAAFQKSVALAAARTLPQGPPGEWRFSTFAGRFVEITGGSATAGLTLSTRLVLEVQQTGGLVAWIMSNSAGFFPPDVANAGVDLRQLAVVRVENVAKRWRICDTLLRSGGFPLVVLQVEGTLSLPLAAQTRLGAVAQHHQATLLAITRHTLREDAQSSLVSMRADTFRERRGHDCFLCGAMISKDKRGLPGWTHEDHCRGTDSLC